MHCLGLMSHEISLGCETLTLSSARICFPIPGRGCLMSSPIQNSGPGLTPPASQDKLGQINCNALLGVNVAQAMGDK